MRVNLERNTMDIEAERDLTMLLKAYLRSYLMLSKNKTPDKIICPAISEVPHPYDGSIKIPVEWIATGSPIAVELAIDVSNVPVEEVEATMVGEEELVEAPTATVVDSPAKKAFADVSREEAVTLHTAPPVGRVPNQPAHVVPPGQPLDDMQPRSKGDLKQTIKDLAQEPEVDENAEREYDIGKEQ